jgi:hypothetical protein
MLLKIFCLLLLILYILLGIYLFKNIKNDLNNDSKIEGFIGILDVLSDSINFKNNPENNEKKNNNSEPVVKTVEILEPVVEKKLTKFIYLEEYYGNDKLFKYNFYDKNNLNYMVLYENVENYKKNILIKDNKNNILGKNIKEHYNKIIFTLELYSNNIILEYYDNYNYIKIYLENDDKIFMIRNNNIYCYQILIGKINYREGKYKIIVYDEYKTYLNIFGIGYAMILHN